jgi:ubiquinone/menaquinone biosynthesis C-methylase UbiE
MLSQDYGRRAQAFFDGLSRKDSWRDIQPRHLGKLAELKARLGTLRGLRVLEPGCGAGALTQHLREWVSPGGFVLSFDSSPGMFEEARRQFSAIASVEVRMGRAEDIELPKGSFDLVLCFRVMPHLESLTRALKLFRGALKPGGRLVICHFEGREELNRIHAEAGGLVAKDVFPKELELREQLWRSGFSVRLWIDTPAEIFIDCAVSSANGRYFL